MPNSELRNPIVYIDNDEDDQVFIQHVMENLDIKNPLQLFKEDNQVLDYLRTTQEVPLMILCDIFMPGMGGLSLREQINANDYLREKSIPFLFLTTSYNLQGVQKAYGSTVQGFFIKAHEYWQSREDFRIMYQYW